MYPGPDQRRKCIALVHKPGHVERNLASFLANAVIANVSATGFALRSDVDPDLEIKFIGQDILYSEAGEPLDGEITGCVFVILGEMQAQFLNLSIDAGRPLMVIRAANVHQQIDLKDIFGVSEIEYLIA